MIRPDMSNSDIRLYALSLFLAFVFLFFDLSLPLGVAAGVPYVGLVLIGWWFQSDKSIFVLASVGSLLTVVGYVISPEGGIAWVVLFNRSLAIAVIWVTAVILSVAKRATQANMKLLRQDYAGVVENAPIGIVSVSPEGKFISVNPAFAKMMGYDSPEDVIESITDIQNQMYVVPSVRTRITEKMARVHRVAEEYQLYRKDGSIIWISEYARAVLNVKGEKSHYECFLRDITKRKESEQKLAETDTFLQQASHVANIGFWVCEHENFTYPFWSESMDTILGINGDETASGKGDIPNFGNTGMTHPDDVDRVQECFQKLVYDGRAMDIEYRITLGNGQIRWIREIGTAIDFHDGKYQRSYGSSQDITERMLSEQTIRESLQLNETIFESSPVGISIFDETGQCISTNDAMCEIVGGSKEGVLAQNYHDISTWRTSGLYEVALESLKAGEKAKHEMNIISTFGKPLFIECHLAPITVKDKQHLLLMITDLTEQKALQAQMIEQSKMATLGEMATGIAHELNQPLNVMRMAVNNIQRKQRKDQVNQVYLEEKLEKVENQIERASAIIDHMRIFGRKSETSPVPLNPNAMIEAALGLIGEQLRLSDINVQVDAPETCLPFNGYQVQIEQVLLNILGNAQDELRDVEGKKEIFITVRQNAGLITIQIEDTGRGIPEDVLPRVFEPFFTTKEIGAGTGLGLSISYGIITDMGGVIEASNTDKGARFTITLPASSEESMAV